MALHHDQDSALAKAIRAIGSQTLFGDLIGKRQSVVSGWLLRGTPLPAEYVLKVEAATGISKHELRPDIYPLEILASQPSPIPEGRTTVCNPAETDPSTAEPLADGGDAARSMSCDHLDRAADTPPIGKAAA